MSKTGLFGLPFLWIFIGFDPIDLSFLEKIWNANGGHGKALQR
jgi:hypothetical protein